MKFTLFDHARDNQPRTHETTWAEFVSDLGPHETRYSDKLSVPAFSPATFTGLRSAKNVELIHFGALDLDRLNPAAVGELCERVEPYQHILYSTWSHTPEAFCARLLVPFDRPVRPEDWGDVWEGFSACFGGFGDGSCKDASRIFFIPACPPEKAEHAFYFYSTEGETYKTHSLARLANELKRSKSEYKADLGERLSKALKGEPFAEEGERDDIIYKLTATIVDRYPNADAKTIADIFEPSLKRMGSNGPSAADVQKKIDRRKAPTTHSLGREPYTKEEIPNLETFPWIIQKAKSYYIFFDGGYLGPFIAEELIPQVKKYLEPLAPVSVTRMGSKSLVTKKQSDLILEYGCVADKIVADLSLSRARYDADSCVLYEAPCPLRVLKPQYDVQVAEWLEALGGPEREQELLEWLSVVTLLGEPCAALYLDGPPGCGKTLLADGLAKLWGGEPVELDSAMAGFNNELIRCPLILADETIPCDWKGRPRTAELRKFIQNRAHTIRRKYMPDIQAYGATRLIITSNNRELLANGENLTSNDIQAIVDRIIYIQCQQQAVKYLQSLGNDQVRSFVSEDKIARHALWLRDNVTIERGARFLVTGADSALNRTMTTSTGLRADLCNWLVDYLICPSKYPDDLLVRRHKGSLLVCVRGLIKHWRIYENRGEIPQTSQLSSALSGLSSRRSMLCAADGRRTAYRVVDFANLVAWSRDSGYASEEILKKALTVDS